MKPTSQPETKATIEEFRNAMRRLVAMVAIVSTRHDGSCFGMTATAVTSLSANPPSLLVCINRSASIRPHLAVGNRFCVNFLSSAHEDLARGFAGANAPDRRFETGNWNLDPVPHLQDAVAVTFCTIDQLIEYGTHSILIGKVDGVALGAVNAPLLYGDGRYLAAN